MKRYLPLFVAVLLCVTAASCDRSDPSGSITVPAKPTFDTATAAGRQAQHIFDTYGLHCHWDFDSDEYMYELTSTSKANYTEVDNLENLAEFLTAFEEKALKVLPIEIIRKAFAHLFICNELQNTYTKETLAQYSWENESETVTELLPMEIKTLGVALGYAGSTWKQADMELLQLRWIEAIFETMLNNTPTPTNFNQAALLDVMSITSNSIYATNYTACAHWGWWCIHGGSSAKEGGYQYDWGLLDPPYTGLSGIAFRDGVEVQEKETMGYSRWYNSGYTSAMDFATYAAFILLKPASYMDELCAQYPLVKQKVQLVKEYFLENFNYELKSIAE